MQVKILMAIFATTALITIFIAMLDVASADSFPSSPVQPHSKQDAMKSMITDGLRLANQSSQQWLEKRNQSGQQEKPLTANALNSHNNKFDNHSPSVIAELPF